MINMINNDLIDNIMILNDLQHQKVNYFKLIKPNKVIVLVSS